MHVFERPIDVTKKWNSRIIILLLDYNCPSTSRPHHGEALNPWPIFVCVPNLEFKMDKLEGLNKILKLQFYLLFFCIFFYFLFRILYLHTFFFYFLFDSFFFYFHFLSFFFSFFFIRVLIFFFCLVFSLFVFSKLKR